MGQRTGGEGRPTLFGRWRPWHLGRGVASRPRGPEAETRFRLLVESADEFAMITMDDAGTIETWNPGAERLLGWSADEAIGAPGAIIFVPEDAAAGVFERELETAKAQGRAIDERWHARKDGSRFWASGMMIALIDDAGRRVGLAKIMRDLTDRRQSQQLQSAQRQILEQIARAEPLAAIVRAVVDLLESQVTGARAEVRLVPRRDEEAPGAGITSGPSAPAGDAAGPGEPPAPAPERAWSTPIVDVRGEKLGEVVLTFDAPAVPSTSAQGVVDVAVQLVATGIERERLATALERERAREHEDLVRAFRLSPVFVALLRGPEHVFKFVNPAYEQLVGHRDVLGKAIRIALPEIEGQGFAEILDRVYRTDEAFVGRQMPTRLARAAGAEPTEGFFDFVYEPTHDASGAVDGILVSGVEVTDAVRARKVAERLAAERDAERRQLETVLAQSPVGIAIAEAPSGRIRFLNDKFVELFGHATYSERAEDYSQSYVGFHADGRRVASSEWPLFRALREGEITEGEVLEIERPDGERRTGAFNAAPILDAEGRVTAGVLLVLDVTEARRAEQQLRDAERLQAVGKLAGGVAHEVNNQMTVVLGFGELVLRALGPDHPEAIEQRHVLEAAERAAKVSQQLLAYTHQQVTILHRLDLVALVERLAPVLRRLLGADKTLVLPPPGARARAICADPGQVEQVLINLVANARDATDTGDRVTIRVEDVVLEGRDPGPRVCLAVADTGRGMDAATRARLFEPFFTTKSVGTGAGLGLSLVYGVVTKHGGSIEVTSEPGRGTELRTYWPPAPGESGEDDAAARSCARGETAPAIEARILVVEDEAIVRRLAVRMLEMAGYEVLGAEDGEAALELLGALDAPPALVVTDAIMPRMNGRQLAEAIEAMYPGVPVLFMSGYTGEDLVLRRIVPEGAPYLQKPFTPEQLERAVSALVAASSGGVRPGP